MLAIYLKHYYENGQLQTVQEHYKSGLQKSFKTYNENGQLKSEEYYKDW